MEKSYPFIDDMDAVMERLGGDEAALDRLLGKFLAAYRDSAAKIDELARSGNLDEARRIAHSAKGAAANLGLAGIRRAAADIERSLASGNAERVALERAALDRELARVASELTAPA